MNFYETFFTGSTAFYSYIFIGFIVFVIIVGSIKRNKLKNIERDFFAVYPDAAHVFLPFKLGLTSGEIIVKDVDGNKPIFFVNKNKKGILLTPGDHMLTVNYTSSNAGILFRTVITSTDDKKVEITINRKKQYILGFDQEENCFTFEEIQGASIM